MKQQSIVTCMYMQVQEKQVFQNDDALDHNEVTEITAGITSDSWEEHSRSFENKLS